jgi:chromosome segregation protein
MAFAGAAYRLCDFQVHTPRDHGWDGKRPDEGLVDPVDIEAARAEWAKELVAYCLKEGVGAIALTDHHECVVGWKVIEAAQGTDLWVFPGMELTAKDSAQALILFDADIPPALFEKAPLGVQGQCCQGY